MLLQLHFGQKNKNKNSSYITLKHNAIPKVTTRIKDDENAEKKL